MQKFENKRVAGGASWKLLKIKGQNCSVVAKEDVSWRRERQRVPGWVEAIPGHRRGGPRVFLVRM
jgi:hypothetical protein